MAVFHTSRWVFLPGYLGGLMLMVVSFFVEQLFWFLLIVGVFGLIITELLVWRERLYLMDDYALYRLGYLGVKTRRVSYKSISDVEVRQSLRQRVLRMGDLEIDTPASSGVEIVCKRFGGVLRAENLLRKHQVRVHEQIERKV